MSYEELKSECRYILDKIRDGAGKDEIIADAARLPPNQQETFITGVLEKNQSKRDELLTALDPF